MHWFSFFQCIVIQWVSGNGKLWILIVHVIVTGNDNVPDNDNVDDNDILHICKSNDNDDYIEMKVTNTICWLLIINRTNILQCKEFASHTNRNNMNMEDRITVID